MGEELVFQETFPKDWKKTKKRNYVDSFGEDNELKKYIDNLYLSNLNKKYD